MKKLILALLAVGTIATANAQQNSILLYGDLGLHTERDANLAKFTMWDANIGVGYQFNPHWTVGLNLFWAQDAIKSGIVPPSVHPAAHQGEKFTVNSYAIGPFVRYTSAFGKSEIFSWYAQMDFEYAGGYTTNEGNPAFNKHTGIFVDLFPAIAINVYHGLALNFGVGGINYRTDKFDGATYSDNRFNFTFGNMVNLGISKNFGCGTRMHSHHEPGDEVHRRKADRMEDEDDAAPRSKRKVKMKDEDE